MINVQKHRIDSCYVTSRFQSHVTIKNDLLKLIERQITSSSSNNEEKIDKTDWYIPQEYIREYWNFLFPKINEHIIEVNEYLELGNFKYTNHWCNVYDVGNFRDWHRHIESSWAHVYYVHLPNAEYSTEIKSDYNREIIKPIIEEGMILSFPSGLLHRSPQIKDGNKIVISFNTLEI